MATRLSPSLEAEKGHGVGLGWVEGFPWDPSEWSPELTWPQSVRVFDQMRRQDGQIKSVLRAVTLPIRRTRWALDGEGVAPEVLDFCKNDLGLPEVSEKAPPPRPARIRDRFRWADHLRMALLYLVYGHMAFEQVYDVRDGMAHLAKLGARLPPTIGKINVSRAGDLEGIEQYPTGQPGDTGPYIVIPADRLVYYCHEREAGVWQGESMLRPVYANWLIKGKLLRVHAMTMERNGMGVPLFVAPDGATQAQIDQGNKAAQAWRAGENSGASVPQGGDIKLVGVSGTLPDVLAGIKYHDEQIAGSILAQFLELGRTAHGSRALGSSFIDFFILALQAVADEVASTATAEIVEDLVDLNWGPDEPAPRIVVTEIGEEHTLTAEALNALITAGAVQPDDELEDYLRENYRLPERGTPRPKSTPANPFGNAAGASRGKVRAGRTPATSKTWAGWRLDRRLVNHYAPVIARALAGAIDAKAIVRSFKQSGLVQAAAEPHDVDAARAYLNGADWNLDDASVGLSDLYQASYVAGAHAGRVSIGGVAAPEWDAGIDWSNWTPGDLQAAAELAAEGGRGLATLLADADITIRSVADNRIDSLAQALADGVANGDSIDTIAASLTDLLDDPDRAGMIANTEVARAMTSASLDTYAANGIGQKEFLTSDPCPECQENEDQGAIGIDEDFVNGDPPVHPNCQCALLPVIETDTGETEGEEE